MSGSLHSSIILAIDVAPVNDPPRIIVPLEFTNDPPLTAEEDQMGTIGTDCCGWSDENTLGGTTISQQSITLIDADIDYESRSKDGADSEKMLSRWTVSPANGSSSQLTSSSAVYANDTVTVTISVKHGGVLLREVRSQVSMSYIEAEDKIAEEYDPTKYVPLLVLGGPLWAVARSVRSMRYRSNRNWNSWVGSGSAGLEPVILEVGCIRLTKTGFLSCPSALSSFRARVHCQSSQSSSLISFLVYYRFMHVLRCANKHSCIHYPISTHVAR